MSRTISISEVGSSYDAGWHELTIRAAKYGKHEDSAYIDVWFEDYPDNFNMRTWAKNSKDSGEEWCIARLFRFANAGIVEALEEDGKKRATLNDDAEQLIGKRINILFFKEEATDGNEYGRPYLVPAPTVFSNVVETFTEANVISLKRSAVENWTRMGKGTLPDHVLNGAHTNGVHNGTATTTEVEEEESATIPF
jgi:hypothetical protein